MRNIKLTIEYDGTKYHGWQSQKNALAIQEVVMQAIFHVTGETVNLCGSSRTDAGVHAFGQVANFHTESTIPPERFSFVLNRMLPNDIVIRKSEAVEASFHARFSSIGKRYQYIIYNDQHRSAIHANRTWHIFHSLDADKMAHAAKELLGTHDFASFRSTGSNATSSVRTITQVSVVRKEAMIYLEIAGNGFLYNMVRIIAGTLAEIGFGKLPFDSMGDILKSCERVRAGITAPPQGLHLWEVYFK